MSKGREGESRRKALKTLGALGTAAALGAAVPGKAAAPPPPAGRRTAFRSELDERVLETPIVDTHEHLPDEDERLAGRGMACDDWAVLLSHYVNSDLISAGMPGDKQQQFLSRGLDPLAKWRLIAPYWPAVKNTGYGRVVRIAVKELYGIDELDEKAIPRLQQGYESLRKPGFYHRILVERGRLESCQVNYLGGPFKESRQPTLLMQDLSIVGMHMGPDLKTFGGPTGIQVRDLNDWHAVIRWWFDKYAPYAVAVKSQAAYSRGLDYDRVPPEKAEPVFQRILRRDPVSAKERKLVEDHLFWYAVEQATKHALPVKLHTGYYAGHNGMPLGRVAANPAQASDLCRKSPGTTWVFMHIAYPYWQDLIAVAKHYTNAHIDMCWAWIMDPIGSTQFLKSYLVTAPANKVLTFGGDYIPVECVLGHVKIARQGIAQALREVVEEGWVEPGDALELVDPLLRGNARRIFQLETKLARLRKAPWA